MSMPASGVPSGFFSTLSFTLLARAPVERPTQCRSDPRLRCLAQAWLRQCVSTLLCARDGGFKDKAIVFTPKGEGERTNVLSTLQVPSAEPVKQFKGDILNCFISHTAG